MRVLGNPPYLEVPVELALPETNPARTSAIIVTPSYSGFSERDPHRMMRMRDLDEGLV